LIYRTGGKYNEENIYFRWNTFHFFLYGIRRRNGFEGKPITDNIWMPTGNILNRAEFDIGLGPIGVGLNDNVQFQSSIKHYKPRLSRRGMKRIGKMVAKDS
jgi:hypothetical protein